MTILKNESGQILVTATLSLSLLLGALGIAIDVGLLYRDKRVMQIAADAGAVDGAAELGAGDWNAAGNAGAALNGYSNGVNGATVTVNNPPLAGAYAGKKSYVEVTVSQGEPLFFMKAGGFGNVTVSARAVAEDVPSQDCIITLGTDPQPPGAAGAGINESGSASLSAPTCGIIDNGDQPGESAVALSGSASITAKSLTSASTIGSGDLSHITTINPTTPTTGITPVSDPLDSTVAPTNPGGCTAKTYSSNATIGPSGDGTICYSSLTISGGSTTVTLNPGVYYINGNLTIQGGASVNCTGTCAASGVTFYITNNGTVTVSGGSALNLTAPTSGALSGILFWQSSTDTQQAQITGGSSGSINGILYFPDAGLTLSGGSGTTFNVDLVVSWLNITGPSTINQYAPLDIPPTIPDPVLAE